MDIPSVENITCMYEYYSLLSAHLVNSVPRDGHQLYKYPMVEDTKHMQAQWHSDSLKLNPHAG